MITIIESPLQHTHNNASCMSKVLESTYSRRLGKIRCITQHRPCPTRLPAAQPPHPFHTATQQTHSNLKPPAPVFVSPPLHPLPVVQHTIAMTTAASPHHTNQPPHMKGELETRLAGANKPLTSCDRRLGRDAGVFFLCDGRWLDNHPCWTRNLLGTIGNIIFIRKGIVLGRSIG